uniref:EB domain-containing protein n=1 Tax=Romanomermis culicivorax TaxID=13658 RepID=A0A915JSR9_ROMCU
MLQDIQCLIAVICGGYSICPPVCKLVPSTKGICDRCDCPPDLLVTCNATSQAICHQYNAHCKDGFCLCQKGYSMIPDAKTCLKNFIGSKCIDNVDCSAAHSHCYHGECMCKHGFEPDQEGLCQAKTEKILSTRRKKILAIPPEPVGWFGNCGCSGGGLFCPVSRKEAQTSSPCFVEHPGPNQPFQSIQGNCTAGEFCLLYHDHIDPDGNHIGHCCKRPGNEDSVRSTCAMSPSRGGCGDSGGRCLSPDLYCMEQLYW